MNIQKDFLWVEKYRPQTISDCILPVRLLKTFKSFIKEGDHSHLLLTGTAGTGKTTVAKALCNDMDRFTYFLNGSDENGIDTFRTTIKDFATRGSIDGRKKTIIVDEADYLNKRTIQPALRSFLEEYAHICKFIFTMNNPSLIISPLISRCHVVSFSYTVEEKKEVAKKYQERLKEILKLENIEYDSDKTLLKLIINKFPDFRAVINSCQGYASSDGKIDIGILASTKTHEDYEGLPDALRHKEFKKLEDYAIRFSSDESSIFYRELFNVLKVSARDESSIFNLILIIGDYQKYHSNVADKYIHILSCLVQIMSENII